jgi:hypothetical protein
MQPVATIAEKFFLEKSEMGWGAISLRRSRETFAMVGMVWSMIGWRWLTAGRTRGGGRSRWRGVRYDDSRSELLL